MDPDVITLIMLCFAGVMVVMFAAAMVIHADLRVLAESTGRLEVRQSRKRRLPRIRTPQERRMGLRAGKRIKYGRVGL